MSSKIIVSDTTAIIHLSRINALQLLHKLYGVINIPQAVYDEIVSHGDDLPGAKEVKTYTWIKTVKVKNMERVQLYLNHLDLGEAEAIALARELSADLLIIDEKIGRAHAHAAGLNITGMIGILLLAKEKNYIAQIKPYLDRLLASKFKLGMKLYDIALEKAGEKNESKKA